MGGRSARSNFSLFNLAGERTVLSTWDKSRLAPELELKRPAALDATCSRVRNKISQPIDTSTLTPNAVGQSLSWDGSKWSTHSDGRVHHVQGNLVLNHLAYTVGTPEKQFKDVFVGAGSIYLGNGGRIALENGKVTVKQGIYFRSAAIMAAGGTESNVLAFTGAANLSAITLEQWINYANTLSSFNNSANINNIFDTTFGALSGDVAAFWSKIRQRPQAAIKFPWYGCKQRGNCFDTSTKSS